MASDTSDTAPAAAATAADGPGGRPLGASLENLMRGAVAETRRPLIALELVSFAVVGGVAALSYVILSVALIALGTGIPNWIVSVFCYALFIIPAYLAHRRYSFRSESPHAVALPRYVAVQLSAVTLASLFSYLCYSVLGLETAVAAMLVIGLTSGVNFVVLKLWAFAHRG